MKKLIFILPLFIFGCKPSQNIIQKTQNVNFAASENVKFSYNVDSETVGETLKTLSSDDFEGREAGTPGMEKAAKYLETYFEKNNIKPYFKSYRDTLTNYFDTAYNIVGYLEGNDPILKNEFVVLGGHYDHLGFSENPVNGDKIYNGANDDASGVTAVAEIAKYFGQNKTNKRSILFVFFTGEEKGLLGSKHLSKKLKSKKFNIYSMLNFEMIGAPMKRDYLAYITGFDKTNMASKMNEYAGKKLIGFLPKEAEFQLFYRSDNFSFYNEFKVPSQTICTFDFENFDFYHHVSDDFEHADIPHMTHFIQEVLPVVEKMVNAPNKEIKFN
jgi:Zn-dependent M28 family amino/carboxypeptidase